MSERSREDEAEIRLEDADPCDLFPPAEQEVPDEHTLAARIVAEHAAVCAASHDALQHAIACGKLLMEAKANPDIGHGNWLPWVETNCGLSKRTAQTYMYLARNLARLSPEYAQRAAHLSIRDALKRLASPQALRAIDGARPEVESIAESTGRRVGQGLPASMLKTMLKTERENKQALAWLRTAPTAERLGFVRHALMTMCDADLGELLNDRVLRGHLRRIMQALDMEVKAKKARTANEEGRPLGWRGAVG